MELNKMNGFTIVNSRPVDLNDLYAGVVILGVRKFLYHVHGYEYVVAVTESLDSDHWFNGHYTFSMQNAMEVFTNER